MILRHILRSVSRRTCWQNVNVVGCCGIMSNSMEPTFEENIMGGKGFSTAKCETKDLTNGNAATLNGVKPNTDEEQYEEAINTLNTLQTNADSLRRSIELNYTKQKPLDETLIFMERCDLKREDLEKLSFIHVSGTKGKGSTCALTESIIRSHGHRTGFFSSPHLVAVTERIRLNGQPISKSKFTKSFWKVFNRLDSTKKDENDMPAYFKFLTLLFFHIMLEEQVDVILLEVGIGGELDCTNILRNTEIVGITSLGLEHTQLLGDTLQQVAWQKAGIIKPNSKVFTSVAQAECLRVIEQRVDERKAASYNRVPEFEKYLIDRNNNAAQLKNLNNITQLNGSLAIQLAHAWLRTHGNKQNDSKYNVNSTELSNTTVNGLLNCIWPGRCQMVNLQNYNIHLDGAHTVESIQVCSNWFYKVSGKSSNPKVLIFNTTGDRDSKKLLNILRMQNNFNWVCFVPNISSAESSLRKDLQTVHNIAQQLQRARMHEANWQCLCQAEHKTNNSQVFGSILDSFQYIQEMYGNSQEIDVLVTGSLHLIGATVLALNEFKHKLQQC